MNWEAKPRKDANGAVGEPSQNAIMDSKPEPKCALASILTLPLLLLLENIIVVPLMEMFVLMEKKKPKQGLVVHGPNGLNTMTVLNHAAVV